MPKRHSYRLIHELVFYAEYMRMKSTFKPLSAALLTTGLSVTLICGLTGCAPEGSKGSATQTPASTKTAQTATATGDAKGASSALPTPTGTLTPKLEFTCANLGTALGLNGYTLNTSFTPDPSTAEGRAVSSGGSSCQWEASGSKWVSASVEKVSPEDYRDFAESLGGFYTPASFGSTNDSLEFFSTDGASSTAKVLNTSYLISVNSNSVLDQKDLGPLAHKTELLLVG